MRKFIHVLLAALIVCIPQYAFAQFSPMGSGCATCLQLSGGTLTGALTASSSGIIFNGSTLLADAANVLALRNGTNAQAFHVYNTYADAGVNYERGSIGWAANAFEIKTEGGGTGTIRRMKIISGSDLDLGDNGANRWTLGSGHFYPAADNAYDLGISASRARTAYIATSIQGTASKTLADGVATDFVTISVPVGGMVGGLIEYTVTGTDATDFQSRSGVIPFAAVNKAGTETAAVGTVGAATEVVAVSAGTLTNTIAVSATAVANGFNLSAVADSSLGTPTVTIQYRVIINSGTATVTGL